MLIRTYLSGSTTTVGRKPRLPHIWGGAPATWKGLLTKSGALLFRGRKPYCLTIMPAWKKPTTPQNRMQPVALELDTSPNIQPLRRSGPVLLGRHTVPCFWNSAHPKAHLVPEHFYRQDYTCRSRGRSRRYLRPTCPVSPRQGYCAPYFRMGFTPSAGKELQSEYFVPRRHAVEAILAVERLRDQISPHLLISEIRTVAADNLWLSPCYHQACVTIL